jgi:hypothetical protein
MKESLVMRMISRWAARYYLKRPDQADLILIKHPRLSDLWPALLNELCYRLRLDVSFRLTSLNIELTNRCNLACGHCLRKVRGGREEMDMDFATFKRVVDGCPTVKNLLPFQWGEPLLHPRLHECLAYAAQRGKRLFLTTNAVLLDDHASTKLIHAGLTRLTVSFDGNLKTHAKLRGVDPDRIMANIKRFKQIRDRLEAPCALDVTMVVNPMTAAYMDEFKTLFEGTADRIQFVPAIVDGPRKRPCRELWRGVLVILSNGDVSLCCADSEGDIVLGSVFEASPATLFNGRILRRLRYRHAQGRLPDLCGRCAEYAPTGVSPRFS